MNFLIRGISLVELKNYKEFVGFLKKINRIKNSIFLDFVISKKVEIPENSINFEELKKLEGKEVGCININGKISFRKIEK